MNPPYPPDTAGRIMGKDFIAIPEVLNVGQAIEKIRAAHVPGKPSYVYVVDDSGHLNGVLFVRDLLFSPSTKVLRELVRQDLVKVPVEMDQEEVARLFQKHRLMALPVVDRQRRLVGVISANDVSQIIQEEATEDMLKVAGIGGGEESFKTPFTGSIRRRLPWLVLNIFLDCLAVSVIAYFEKTLQEVIALAVILPIISDMGGNVGIQTVSVAVRELATGAISFPDFWKIVGRELSVGFLNGFVLGLVLCGVGYIWKGNIFLGLVAGVALWINTVVASMVGAALPLIIKRRGLDPATASGALLTTITDLSGFFLTLSFATFLIQHLK